MSDYVKADVCFNAVDNASKIFTGSDFRGRVNNQSTTKVLWTINTIWDPLTWYNSVDFTTALQELVDRSGWNSGNSAMLLIDTLAYLNDMIPGNGLRIMRQRVVQNSNNQFELHVTWTTGSGTFYVTDYEDDAEVIEVW